MAVQGYLFQANFSSESQEAFKAQGGERREEARLQQEGAQGRWLGHHTPLPGEACPWDHDAEQALPGGTQEALLRISMRSPAWVSQVSFGAEYPPVAG